MSEIENQSQEVTVAIITLEPGTPLLYLAMHYNLFGLDSDINCDKHWIFSYNENDTNKQNCCIIQKENELLKNLIT